MQDYELDAYLGDFADRLDGEQRRVLKAALEKLAQRWPSPDFTDEQTEAGNVATAIIFGDSTAEQIGLEYADARETERVARMRLAGAIVILAAQGASEVAIAERLGVTRMTVRKALGK